MLLPFLRWMHKWIGLILGLQLVLWTFSGGVMALLDHHKVSAEAAVQPQADIALPSNLVSLADVAKAAGGPVLQLKLKPLYDSFVYEATTPAGVRLIDAVTGRPLAVDAARAKTLAVAAYTGFEPVTSVARVDETTLETRKFTLPAWRVAFADKDHTALFVSADTGEILGAKNDTWRLWDVVWMIHIMDYTERNSFNHPLIITVATGVAWLAITGLILLFLSFRRGDFAWILDPLDGIAARRRARAAAASTAPQAATKDAG